MSLLVFIWNLCSYFLKIETVFDSSQFHQVKAFLARSYYVEDGSLFTKVFAALVTGEINFILASSSHL